MSVSIFPLDITTGISTKLTSELPEVQKTTKKVMNENKNIFKNLKIKNLKIKNYYFINLTIK